MFARRRGLKSVTTLETGTECDAVENQALAQPAEGCDGLDNDCDSIIDEGIRATNSEGETVSLG